MLLQIIKTFHARRLPSMLACCALTLCAWTQNARAGDGCLSCSPSDVSVLGSGVVLLGSFSMLAGAETLVVESILTLGDSTVITFKAVSDGATVSVKLSGQTAKGISCAVGSVVDVLAVSTGSLLLASGQAIAFIPNEIGLALLHQSKVTRKP